MGTRAYPGGGEVAVEAAITIIGADKVPVFVDFAKVGVADTTYFLLIDRTGASYKHDLAKPFLNLTELSATARKTKSGAEWTLRIGLILEIDGEGSKIGFLSVGFLSLRDTSRFIDEKYEALFPMFLDLSFGGAPASYAKIAASVETVATVNTAGTLVDAFGAAVVPAVGDLVLEAKEFAGTGEVDFNYTIGYFAGD
jgi:hypothetical protein